jgi:hypothetical protein
MSILTPEVIGARVERGEDVIQGLCHWLYFFASEEAAREWTSERPSTTPFPLEEGVRAGTALDGTQMGDQRERLSPAKNQLKNWRPR